MFDPKVSGPREECEHRLAQVGGSSQERVGNAGEKPWAQNGHPFFQSDDLLVLLKKIVFLSKGCGTSSSLLGRRCIFFTAIR